MKRIPAALACLGWAMNALLVAVALIAVVIGLGCVSPAPVAPAVGSLVCGEPGASTAPGWAQCKTQAQLRCGRARTICAEVSGAQGCETGYSSLAAPAGSTGAWCAEVLRAAP